MCFPELNNLSDVAEEGSKTLYLRKTSLMRLLPDTDSGLVSVCQEALKFIPG